MENELHSQAGAESSCLAFYTAVVRRGQLLSETLSEDFAITVFLLNPNIYPEQYGTVMGRPFYKRNGQTCI